MPSVVDTSDKSYTLPEETSSHFWIPPMLDFSLLEKIYVGDRETLLHDLLQTYRTRLSCTINFLYFANLAHHRLVE